MIDPTAPDYRNTPASPHRPLFSYELADPAEPPAVTIVTPFKDTGAIFHETAGAVLRQSFQQWEWVIVNDGSTAPEALSVLEQYRRFDQRIRVIDHVENQGPSAARNTGFRAAHGQYVVQLDSDNLLEPTAIEKWYWFLETHPEYGFVKGFSVGFGAEEYLWNRGFDMGREFLEANQVDATAMIRRAVHEQVGGYDESIRDGLEDWEFWLRCASFGHWGGTVPEYLDWYRRRPSHTDRWKTWDVGKAQKAFRAELRRRYPRLWDGGFPRVEPRWHLPHESVPDDLPRVNRLRKAGPRVLMLVPWLTVGGADKFNLDLVQELSQRGWEVTIATTFYGDNAWLPGFARYTPDIFVLDHFLRLADYPRFIRHLVRSRQIDRVLLTQSELAYLLLPYLRAHLPDVAFVDFCHMEEEYWKSGGYPRMSLDRQELLDLTIVASEHVRRWMVQRGADPGRIRVCHTNIDPEQWRPDPSARSAVRAELRLDARGPVVLYAGRVCTQKQPEVLARTALQLVREGLDFVLLVAGTGPELGQLRAFVAKHGLGERVLLLGQVSSQRIRELMAASDIFFLPSQWEGISLAIYEAMACGLPIVGADVGGQRELVTPDCGVLIPRGDEHSESRRYVEELSALLKDGRLREAMGSAARARVSSQFRLGQMGLRMTALLEEAVSLHGLDLRPAPSLGLAQAHAVQAVEYVRLSQLAEQLWAERNGASHVHSLGEATHWRARLFLALYRWHEPYYRWYSKRGWTWLGPVREKVKRVLVSAS